MGITKTDQFSATQNEMAVLLKAIGHPARVAIIEYLLKVNSCICGDIVNELPLSQATISQHLRELREAGIIRGNIEGTAVCYCVDIKTLQKIERYLSRFVEKAEINKNKCC